MKEYVILLGILLTLSFLSCRDCDRTVAGDNNDEESTTSASYAERFTIIPDSLFTTLLINEPWQGASGITHKYYLVPHKHGNIVLPDDGQVIRVPVKAIVCMSVTHAGMIKALGSEETIRGMSGTSIVYSESLRELIAEGKIREVGYEESLDREAVFEINPDVIITYGVGGESAGYFTRFADVGINILYNAEYLEQTPLGKAEWIKVFGALLDKERIADSLFMLAEHEYNEVRVMADSIKKSDVKVMLGLPWKDTWYVSPGNSYINRLIEDAGGSYIWGNTSSEISMPLGTENVYVKALEADIWLNSGAALSLKDIELADHRLATLPVYQKALVYNNIKRVTPEGGNDYWETGTVRPGLILKDLVYIFHGSRATDSNMVFYERLR
jgi:iron complex transport system substrate-binding protein